VSVSVRDFLEYVAVFCQELVVLGSSLQRARLAPSRSQRDKVIGYDFQ
jgi:hypothetical protein